MNSLPILILLPSAGMFKGMANGMSEGRVNKNIGVTTLGFSVHTSESFDGLCPALRIVVEDDTSLFLLQGWTALG